MLASADWPHDGDAVLTLDSGGAAVVDLRDFLEPGPFLDVGQQGIPSRSSTRRGLRRLRRPLSHRERRGFSDQEPPKVGVNGTSFVRLLINK